MNKMKNISKQPQKKIENERRYQYARNVLKDGSGMSPSDLYLAICSQSQHHG